MPPRYYVFKCITCHKRVIYLIACSGPLPGFPLFGVGGQMCNVAHLICNALNTIRAKGGI